MKYFGFITARSNSSRLKKKCLLKFGRYTVIEHAIIRAIKNGMEYQIKNLRLTLDYIEDYIMLEKVRSKCGNFASRKKINNFLKHNKDVIKMNYFRNKDWKKNLKI